MTPIVAADDPDKLTVNVVAPIADDENAYHVSVSAKLPEVT